MKVVHICFQDFGGAGKAAYRLNLGLRNLGIDSTMIVLGKKSDDISVKVLPDSDQSVKFSCVENPVRNSMILNATVEAWVNTLSRFRKRPAGLELFTGVRAWTHLENCTEIQEADLINLHWIPGIVDYRKMETVFKDKPVVWTLHDMNAFTGGCHYAGNCIKYKSACYSCEQLGSVYIDDLSNYNWNLKKNVYKNLDLHIVTPSNWLAECAKESFIFSSCNIHVIPYGFPLFNFKPYNKKDTRKEYNIEADVKIILFGADDIANKRKGFEILLKSLEELKVEDPSKVKLAVFGKLENDVIINSQFEVINFGSIADEKELAKIYSLADVFALPSLEDNLPNTIIEAMACGTPVVGFNIGGIPDMISHMKTGYLAEAGNVSDLAKGIKTVLFKLDAEKISDNCVEIVKQKYYLEKQAGSYLQLYKDLLRRDYSQNINTISIEYAESLIEIGKYKEAKEILYTLLENETQPIDALNDLAVVYLLQKNYDKAEQYLNSVFTIDNRNKVAYSNYKYIIEQKQNSKPAEKLKPFSNNLPKISIVTPSYNQAEFLEECIKSVISQGYPNLEYIIMDGGSTDGSVEIIKKYEKHLTYWQSKPDGGQYAAVEAGMNMATGDILGWINSDDRLYPQCLQTIASLFIKNPGIEWITGRPTILDESGRQIYRTNLPVWSQERYLKKDYKFIQQESTFWKKSLWEKAGSKIKTDLFLAGDLELWTRFFRFSQLYSVDILLGGFRKQPNQKTSSFLADYLKEAEQVLDEEITLMNKSKKLPAGAPEPLNVGNNLLINFGSDTDFQELLQTADNKIADNNLNEAKQLLKQALVIQPNNPELIVLLSELEYKTGNLSDAKILLWNLVNRSLANDEVVEKLLSYEMEEHRYDNALSLMAWYTFTYPSSTRFRAEHDRLDKIFKLFTGFADAHNLLENGNEQKFIQSVSILISDFKTLFVKNIAMNASKMTVEDAKLLIDKVIEYMNQKYLFKAVAFIEEFLNSKSEEYKFNGYNKVLTNSGKILVSAIVSTYNSEHFIEGCLDDLVNQTLFDQGRLEIVIVNSGSEQNEDPIIREYQSRYKNIKYIKTENRETIYKAWNRGIKAAGGIYITNANTDDRHKNDAYEIMVNEFFADESLNLVYADVYQTSIPNDTFESSSAKKSINWINFDPDLILFGCFVGPQPMWKKSLHDKFGYFDENLNIVGDYEFWLRISREAKIRHLKEVLGLYLYSDNSVEHADGDKTQEENLLVQKNYFLKFISSLKDIERLNAKLNYVDKVFKSADYYRKAEYLISARKQGIILENKIVEFAKSFNSKMNGNTQQTLDEFVALANAENIFIDEKNYLGILFSLKGSYNLMRNELEKAQSDFEQALSYNPESSEACMGLGEILFKAELYEASKTMYEWAVKNDPDNTFAFEGLQIVNRKLGVENFDNTIVLEDEISLLKLAEKNITQNEFDEAEKILKGILCNNHDSTDAINNLAVIEILKGNFDEATALISKVIAIDPQNEVARDNLNYLEKLINENINNIKNMKEEVQYG